MTRDGGGGGDKGVGDAREGAGRATLRRGRSISGGAAKILEQGLRRYRDNPMIKGGFRSARSVIPEGLCCHEVKVRGLQGKGLLF